MDGGPKQITLILIASICFVLLFSSCAEKGRVNKSNEYLLLAEKLQDGDIILRKGKGIVSNLISKTLKDTVGFSHCGIVICYGDSIGIIHTLSPKISDYDGVQTCSLNTFVDESSNNSIIVVRFCGGSSEIISAKAKYYLERHIPFDEQYDICDTSSFFCSELPIHIIKEYLGVPICDYSSDEIPKFSIFLNPEYFSIVHDSRREQ